MNVQIFYSFRKPYTFYDVEEGLKEIVSPYYRQEELNDEEFNKMCEDIIATGEYRMSFDSFYDDRNRGALCINIINRSKHNVGRLCFTVIPDVRDLENQFRRLYRK